MNEVPRICPCCGYDLVIDHPIMINDFAMNGAGYPLMWRGEQVKLPPAQAMVCWSLMKAYPQRVTINALLERCTDDREGSNLIRVHVSRIRDALEAMGAPNPIKTMPHAYIWDPRAV